MTFQLTNPSSPNTSDALTSLPIRQNFQSIQSFLNSIDGSLIQAGTIGAAQFASSVNPVTRTSEQGLGAFIASGLNPTPPGAGFVVTIPSGVAYVGGTRVNSLGTATTVAASQDSYVDLDSNGTFTTSGVANGSAAPSLAAGRLRLMKIISGASTVSSIVQGNGNIDSLGNLIGPTSAVGISQIQGQKLFGLGSTYSGSPTTSTPFKIQAGSDVVSTNSGGQYAKTFPTAFPNGLLMVNAQNGDTAADANIINGLFSTSVTGFSVQTNSASVQTLRLNWFAIGF